MKLILPSNSIVPEARLQYQYFLIKPTQKNKQIYSNKFETEKNG